MVTVISGRTGEKKEVRSDPSRRTIITGSGRVITKTRRSRRDGKEVISPKSESQILLEASEARAASRSAQPMPPTPEEEAAGMSFARTEDLERGRMQSLARQEDLDRGFAISSRQAQEERESERSSGAVLRLPSESERLAEKASAASAERTQTGSLKEIFFTAGSFGSALREGEFRQAGRALFPEISQETLMNRPGSIIFGFGTQEILGAGLVSGGSKAVSAAKRTFGTPTIVGKVTGTGTTELTTLSPKEYFGSSQFSKSRVVLRPLEDAKKSEVILQNIETGGLVSSGKQTTVLTQGKLRAGFFSEGRSVSESVIVSRNLRGEEVLPRQLVQSSSVRLPGTDAFLRNIKIVEPDKVTVRSLGVTRVRQVRESGFAGRAITEEFTVGRGVTQRVRFAEKLVSRSSKTRFSAGDVENQLLQQVSRPSRVGSVGEGVRVLEPRLPVTLRGGLGSLPRRVSVRGVSSVGLLNRESSVVGLRSDSAVARGLRDSLVPDVAISPASDVIVRRELSSRTRSREELLVDDSSPIFGSGDFVPGVSVPKIGGFVPPVIVPSFGTGGVGGNQRFGERLRKSQKTGLPPSLIGLTFGIGEKTRRGRVYSGLGIRR